MTARTLTYPSQFHDPADEREDLPALPPVPQAPRLPHPSARPLSWWSSPHAPAQPCGCWECRGTKS